MFTRKTVASGTKILDREIALAARERAGRAAAYAAPRLHEIASATRLVQGGGGMSGADRNYYYYFLPGE
jgi:hypothetical protein